MQSYITTVETLDQIDISPKPGDIIFLTGDLGAGKTTLSGHLIQKWLSDSNLVVSSPTYTYYQMYNDTIVHFDLYRIQNYDGVIRTGIEEILDSEKYISLIEWPDRLE